jgi:hypothetical protein
MVQDLMIQRHRRPIKLAYSADIIKKLGFDLAAKTGQNFGFTALQRGDATYVLSGHVVNGLNRLLLQIGREEERHLGLGPATVV